MLHQHNGRVWGEDYKRSLRSYEMNNQSSKNNVITLPHWQLHYYWTLALPYQFDLGATRFSKASGLFPCFRDISMRQAFSPHWSAGTYALTKQLVLIDPLRLPLWQVSIGIFLFKNILGLPLLHLKFMLVYVHLHTWHSCEINNIIWTSLKHQNLIHTY